MSWQSYVDDHLLCELPKGGCLTAAAIVGLDGGVWAQNDAFPNIEQSEVEKLVAGFDDSIPLAAGGIFIGGEKYMMLAGEPGAVIRGRGKDNKSRGVTVKKTVSAMVIGIYDEGVQPADCNQVVEALGDYLVGQGI
mmetsp:Transcript_5584/g.15981  ORF Transcript_5584/g.15981 Transcript_5584/m.15981 type:complete len:136 (-) Transcript_5584:413-820(-)|eukprot:CAMPEP_0206150738 /NCGR_PEP_ID=MMETSP1473-20131121/38456_1 /ASSEMBLY_ACC=CAM_ASM_001109 /TAXON_ID=1461547 /ORGANISM="Stichococcus sp, Strain RCC1054" /LENGTH=135 /DNA_ID=CAMNT_0053548253 /DNA_START=271 /DNA_END=678 /DNA_ORIENTATION=+